MQTALSNRADEKILLERNFSMPILIVPLSAVVMKTLTDSSDVSSPKVLTSPLCLKKI